MSNKPKGSFSRLLVIDVETSAVFNNDDQSYDPNTGRYAQAVSYGLIVVDAKTLKPIEHLYLEVKWDGKSYWNPKAEAVHGLSKEHLEKHGVTREEAVVEIGNLIIKHWGPNTAVNLAGHNPGFDKAFLRRDLREVGLEINFAVRMVDTNSIGFIMFNTFNSDDLFEIVGITRDPNSHNALEDAMAALKVLQTAKQLADQCFGE